MRSVFYELVASILISSSEYVSELGCIIISERHRNVARTTKDSAIRFAGTIKKSADYYELLAAITIAAAVISVRSPQAKT